MPSDRTLVTEIATGLGTLGWTDVAEVISVRPTEMANLDSGQWDRLEALWGSGDYEEEFAAGFENGASFLESPDALNGRRPRVVEWTGERRPPGDEVVPSDLRIDHVYLVSCKYLSRILHNPSPARLVDSLLAQGTLEDPGDWYQRVAAGEFQELYRLCASASGESLPSSPSELTREQRRSLARTLRDGWPPGAEHAYREMCSAVAETTALRWSARLGRRNIEVVLWRLLRIGSAPYFVLGASAAGTLRLRIDSPWDWRQRYRIRELEVTPQPGGQPRVGWSALYQDRATGSEEVVHGHVEIRWSHGRFAQPPEAKVYLDSPLAEVPGYNELEPGRARQSRDQVGDQVATWATSEPEAEPETQSELEAVPKLEVEPEHEAEMEHEAETETETEPEPGAESEPEHEKLLQPSRAPSEDEAFRHATAGAFQGELWSAGSLAVVRSSRSSSGT